MTPKKRGNEFEPDDDDNSSKVDRTDVSGRDRGSSPNDYEGKQSYRDSGSEYDTERDLG